MHVVRALLIAAIVLARSPGTPLRAQDPIDGPAETPASHTAPTQALAADAEARLQTTTTGGVGVPLESGAPPSSESRKPLTKRG